MNWWMALSVEILGRGGVEVVARKTWDTLFRIGDGMRCAWHGWLCLGMPTGNDHRRQVDAR